MDEIRDFATKLFDLARAGVDGLAIVPVMMALLGLRSMMEERMLTAELDGYAEYLTRVRYRLVPMVW